MSKIRVMLFSGLFISFVVNGGLHAQDNGLHGKDVIFEHDFKVNKKLMKENGPREKWPCLSYSKKCGKISTRKPKKHVLSGKLNGSPERGKMIALKKGKNKGNCIACHKLRDGDQHGTAGPDLSTYGTWGRTDAQTYSLVSDMRIRNQSSMMPPFGTNRILDDQAIRDVVAYLQSLK